ncbi:hypothetical protein LJC63_06940 [Ruminococcaceae bacterium OttesenSCG-928-L11]|nr:hypothetical protein [Ruminococcaceae bacterium OttesenSCG-928-L11]
MSKNVSRAISIGLAVLMIAFIGLQGLPYFYSEEGGVSIAGYLAFPTDHTATTAYLESQVEGYNINSIVGGCILLQIVAIALAILLLKFSGNAVVMGASGLWGLVGLVTYGFNAALGAGGGARTIYMVLFVVALAAGVCGAALSAVKLRAGQQQNAPESSENLARQA